MRINCDYFKDGKRARLAKQAEWHDWFAWYPVRIGKNDCRWLETVKRCRYGFAQRQWLYDHG